MTTLTDTQREFASAIASGVATAIKPAEAAKPAAPDLKALLGQAPAGSVYKYGEWEIKLPEKAEASAPKPAADDGDVETAEVGRGPLLGGVTSGIDKIKLFKGVPLGSVIIGAGVGVVINEAINGLAPRRVPTSATDPTLKLNTTNVAYKAGAIFALSTFGKVALPPTAVTSAVTVVGADLLATVLPINVWACKLANFFRPDTGKVNCDAIAPLSQGTMRQTASAPARQNYPLISSPGNDILANALGGR